MTCLLKLIKRELLSLFGTVVLIGLILTIFSGAFMAVAFVYLDVPPGIEGYYKDIGTYFNVVLRNESLNEGLGLGGDWTYGCKFGLTTNVTIKGNQTVTAGYFQTKDNPFHNIADAASSTQGITLTPENAFRFENVWGGSYPTAGGSRRWTRR